MPECLNNQEGLFPGYYDPRYDQAPNQFQPGNDSLDDALQLKAVKILGTHMSPVRLKALKDYLDTKGLMSRNMGDPSIDKAVEGFLKKLKLARKVAKLWPYNTI